MIMDAQLLASDGQNFTGSTGTLPSTNAIDLGISGQTNTGRDISRGEPVRAIARVTAAFTGGVSIKADLVESDSPDLSGFNTIATGAAVTTGSAGLGATLADVPLPKVSRRYVGFSYTVSGTMSGGKVTAGLVLTPDSGSQFAAYTGA
jgi:hypothetical protein